jgi:CheY-like chemotaxis protein
MAAPHDINHLVSGNPRVMVVDGSKLVRKLIGDVLRKELPEAEIIACAGLAEAQAALATAPVDLVTTALSLPDGDGEAVARAVRTASGQAYVPVIVVSGEAQSRLEARSLGEDVTDYFDKALGHQALAAFVRGYVRPQPIAGARVLYVEDSRTVAAATKRILAAQGLEVVHVLSAEDALEYLHEHRPKRDRETGAELGSDVGVDIVLSDVYLKGVLSGHELLSQIRSAFGYGKRRLPVLVMTGDDNREKQGTLLREGANDLVLKPIEERLLVTKLLFQLRVAAMPEQKEMGA